MLDTVVRMVAGLALVLANAFFVVTEFALTRLRQFPAETVKRSPGLRRAWEMTERLEIYLTACQLGITASSVLLGVVVEPAVTRLLEPIVGLAGAAPPTRHLVSVVLAVVAINLVHKIWGEQAPTYLGVERPLQVAERLAPALFWWTRATYPLIYFGDGLAKATLRVFGVEMRRSWTRAGAAEGSEGEGPITSLVELRERMQRLLVRARVPGHRLREIVRALDIQEIPIRDIMVPREEVIALRAGAPVEDTFRTIGERGFVRLPVVGESLDDVRGILYLPALFAAIEELRSGEIGLEDVAVPPLWLASDLPVSAAIDRMQEARQEVALVGEPGRLLGLVTATDAFEAIAGEMEDPLD